MIDRRFLLLGAGIGAIGALSGCGFRPIYAARGPGGAQVTNDLGLIDVGLVPERIGQELRLAMQQRLEGPGAPVEKRYDLQLILAFNEDTMGVLTDSSITRLRYSGAVTYILRQRGSKQTVMTSGSAKLMDAANVFDNQPFASDVETENIERRMMGNLADLVAEKIAAYFQNHPGGVKSSK